MEKVRISDRQFEVYDHLDVVRFTSYDDGIDVRRQESIVDATNRQKFSINSRDNVGDFVTWLAAQDYEASDEATAHAFETENDTYTRIGRLLLPFNTPLLPPSITEQMREVAAGSEAIEELLGNTSGKHFVIPAGSTPAEHFGLTNAAIRVLEGGRRLEELLDEMNEYIDEHEQQSTEELKPAFTFEHTHGALKVSLADGYYSPYIPAQAVPELLGWMTTGHADLQKKSVWA